MNLLGADAFYLLPWLQQPYLGWITQGNNPQV